MLKLKRTFDLHKDVVCDLRKKEASVCRVKEFSGDVDARILNIECDGGILYSWKGATGTTRIGKYDPETKQNKLLYTFDKQVCVSSCSLNKEETLLAVSLAQNAAEVGGIRPAVRCLSLLIEIHPINNTKVLKAVDCRVKVQFLHQEEADRRSVLESHLLLLTEDGYVDLYHVLLSRQEGYRVVMSSPERLSRAAERIIEELRWVQWDGHTQRLYYVTQKGQFLLRCVQFYPRHYCETVLELPLEMAPNSFPAVKFVNLGFDHYHTEKPEQELVKMEVFTDRIGSMCICYNHPVNRNDTEVVYTLALVHKGCSKTFHASLGSVELPERSAQLRPLFIPIGYYIAVYVEGCFLHLVNTRQQEMLCHSLFLSGHEVDLGLQWGAADLMVVHSEEKAGVSLLELSSGRVHAAELSATHLLQILRADEAFKYCEPDPARLAALHCLLVYMGNDPNLELKIIEWLCDGVSSFQSFDHIQEFVLASLYRICYEKSLNLDKILPYSSVFDKKDIPKSLLEIPGVKCTTELHTETIFNIKASVLSGFWSELQWNTERIKYLEAVPNPRYRPSHVRDEWDKLQKSERRPSSQTNHIEENTKKVLSTVDTWSLDKKVVPLFQEEDAQQRALIGLTVDKLRDHLNRHLPRLGKKKIDSLVVSYVAKLLELVRHMLETVWLKYKLGPRALCLSQRGRAEDWAVFHFMCRILEAAVGLCLPLPPGFHTLLAVLAVRCLPHHSFLQYIDHKLLRLTDTFVARLMTDLDNSDANEKLKFSVLKRLPQPMEQTIIHMWDHPITSASISRDYVRALMEKQNKTKGFALSGRERPGFRPEFLPLTYLAKMLCDIEEQDTNPFEEQENVDARFVEETALKQTFILLGFEEK